jgi:two-component system, cell cycle sensor histidine kinase and response regulator CckA
MNRALIVDDQEPSRYLLRSLLEGHGYEVEEARHGAEALTRARQRPPGIIISDLLMPVMDGYTLLRHWKRDPQLREIPFVVYTATYSDPRDESLARDLGADAFVIKPDDPDLLMIRLQEILARKDPTHPPSGPNSDHDPRLLQRYNEVLVRKLENKVEELEKAHCTLNSELIERRQKESRIQEQLEELRRWHDALLDREGRVLELKREVNQLLLEAGRPVRYPSAAEE